MKKIIICITLIAFATTSYSQQIVQKKSLTKEDYLQKSKKQKKTAWILLAGGVGLVAISMIIPNGELVYDGICGGNICTDKYKNDGIILGFFIAGSLSTLSSIPFFIASSKNKRRAMRASVFINSESMPVLQGMAISNRSFPALSVKINL